MRSFRTNPPKDHASAWKFVEKRFQDASNAWANSDPTLSAMCRELAAMMSSDEDARERVIAEMDEAIRQHWLGFAQLVVGMPSYNVIWNSSPAYRDASRASVEQVSDNPDHLVGTNELLAEEIALIALLPKGSPYERDSKESVASSLRTIPRGIEECSSYTAERLDEVGHHWNRSIPWLAQLCALFIAILTMPHRDRERAFRGLDNRLKLRLTGAFMLVGGNGLVANVLFPTIDRYNTDPSAASIPAEYLEDRNARVAEHFRQRQEWLAT